MKLIILLMLVSFQLVGCSATSSEEEEKPTTISFSIVASNNINPNSFGESSPLEFQIYELEDDSMLISADYDQVTADDKATLKSNFVDRYDYVLTPGQFKFVDTFDIDSDTNYIGIVAHFSEPNLSEWKQVIKVKSKGREYHMLIYLRDFDVLLDKVE